jgi:hypothetical protein
MPEGANGTRGGPAAAISPLAALDRPDAVVALALLDGAPIIEALERSDEKFARLW